VVRPRDRIQSNHAGTPGNRQPIHGWAFPSFVGSCTPETFSITHGGSGQIPRPNFLRTHSPQAIRPPIILAGRSEGQTTGPPPQHWDRLGPSNLLSRMFVSGRGRRKRQGALASPPMRGRTALVASSRKKKKICRCRIARGSFRFGEFELYRSPTAASPIWPRAGRGAVMHLLSGRRIRKSGRARLHQTVRVISARAMEICENLDRRSSCGAALDHALLRIAPIRTNGRANGVWI